MPAVCPSCGTPPVGKGALYRLPQPLRLPRPAEGAPGPLRVPVTPWTSRAWGQETATLFVNLGLVRELADLFDIREEQLTPLEGFGALSAKEPGRRHSIAA